MIARIYSAAPIGVGAHPIEIEASVENALPQIHITGLPGAVVRESRDRIRACLKAMGSDVPTGRITLHLSPAGLPKTGSHYDLAMALALLGAENKLDTVKLRKVAALGELSLDGRIRGVASTVALLETLERDPLVGLILLPSENIESARLLKTRKSVLVSSLTQCFEVLRTGAFTPIEWKSEELTFSDDQRECRLDVVTGQEVAKRALEICIAGGHHLLMIGPPGVGKSLLASCGSSLFSPLSNQERIDLHKIYGSLGVSDPIPTRRPFRRPHHSISQAGLLGGGSACVVPGEVSLAHHGVLFLDELTEFRRDCLEGLREPLQNAVIHHHRSMCSVELPAQFTLIGAMNPCPCGFSMSKSVFCSCSQEQVVKYRKRLSGPFLDRIDLVVLMQDRPIERGGGRSHKDIFETVQNAVKRKRTRAERLLVNNQDESWLNDLVQTERLSYRVKSKILRVAETIADLEGSSSIERKHLQEAWGFRCTGIFGRSQSL